MFGAQPADGLGENLGGHEPEDPDTRARGKNPDKGKKEGKTF